MLICIPEDGQTDRETYTHIEDTLPRAKALGNDCFFIIYRCRGFSVTATDMKVIGFSCRKLDLDRQYLLKF